MPMNDCLAQKGMGLVLSGLFTWYLLPCLSLAAAVSQVGEASSIPNTNEIVAQLTAMNAKRAAALRSYSGLRLYELDYKGLPTNKHAKMTVHVRYETPNIEFKVISMEGSKLLLNQVLLKLLQSEREDTNHDSHADTALNDTNYNFVLLGDDLIAGRTCYVLQVTPKRPNKHSYTGKVWVDAEEFAVVRMKVHPFKNLSFWLTKTEIDHQYAKHGDFWLASTNLSTSKIRLGGQAILRIEYRDYQIGLADQGQ